MPERRLHEAAVLTEKKSGQARWIFRGFELEGAARDTTGMNEDDSAFSSKISTEKVDEEYPRPGGELRLVSAEPPKRSSVGQLFK